MRRVYHLEIKSTGDHNYYGSLVALYEAKKELLNISLSSLQHFNFDDEKFETENYIIRKGSILTTNDVRRSSSSDKTTISKWLSENDVPVRIQTILTGKSAYGYSNKDWAQKLEYIKDITERQWLKCHLGSKKNWLIFKKLRGY